LPNKSPLIVNRLEYSYMTRNALSFFLLGIFTTLFFFSSTPVIAQEVGEASYYSDKYDLKGKTASGELYDKRKYTAAHRTLPFQTWVRVTNLKNGRTTQVRINDRGPFKPGRIIDVSRAAAEQLGMVQDGVVRVRMEVIQPPKGAQNGNTPIISAEPEGVNRPPVDLDGLPVVDANGNPKGASPSEATDLAGNPLNSANTGGNGQNPTDEATTDPELEKYTPNLFRMVAYKSDAGGYGVQVGAFFSYYRLLEGMDRLAQAGIQNTLVHNGVKDGKPIFRIVVGPFDRRKDADSMKKKLAKSGTKGIVIELSRLK